MKWWEDSVDEMFIAAIVAVIACVTVIAAAEKAINPAALTVAGSAVSGLVVYLGFKPGKKGGNGGGE